MKVGIFCFVFKKKHKFADEFKFKLIMWKCTEFIFDRQVSFWTTSSHLHCALVLIKLASRSPNYPLIYQHPFLTP